MQRLERLLLDRLHRNGRYVRAARRLEERHRVGRIGLVALHIGTHIARRQQPHLDPPGAQRPRPVVRRRAGFHHHQAHRTIVEPALELPKREARALKHLPVLIGRDELEYALGKVNGNGSSIHLGLLRSGFS
jgi:hypothetical protein